MPRETRALIETRSVQTDTEVAPSAELVRAAAELQEACFRVARAPGLEACCADLLTPLAAAVNATRASLMLVNHHTGRLRITAAFGLPGELVGRDMPARPRSIGEWVMRNQRPLILNGEVNEERFEG